MSTSEYELSNIETFVLKVHMNCQGCMKRVRKLLLKIEGVYKVNINAEEQKVVVTGSVNPSTLVKKLVKSGKHAEIWNASSNQGNKNSYQSQYLTNEPDASQNQYTTPTFFGREDHHLGPEWFLNQNMGTSAAESKFDQNFAPPFSIENLQNRGNNHSGLGVHEWGWNLNEVSPISEYFHPPSLISNTHGYYHSYQPWKMMHMNYHNHLPRRDNLITNDVMM